MLAGFWRTQKKPSILSSSASLLIRDERHCFFGYFQIATKNDKISICKGLKFFPSPNFSAKAIHAFAQLLPPCLTTQKINNIELVLQIEDMFILFILKIEDATACRRQRRSCSYWWRDTMPGGSIRPWVLHFTFWDKGDPQKYITRISKATLQKLPGKSS